MRLDILCELYALHNMIHIKTSSLIFLEKNRMLSSAVVTSVINFITLWADSADDKFTAFFLF